MVKFEVKNWLVFYQRNLKVNCWCSQSGQYHTAYFMLKNDLNSEKCVGNTKVRKCILTYRIRKSRKFMIKYGVTALQKFTIKMEILDYGNRSLITEQLSQYGINHRNLRNMMTSLVGLKISH